MKTKHTSSITIKEDDIRIVLIGLDSLDTAYAAELAVKIRKHFGWLY